MRSTLAAISVAVLLLLSLAIPALANPGSETATAQINVAIPTGQRLLGVLTLVRDTGTAKPNSQWSFNGTVDGTPGSAKGTANVTFATETTGVISIESVTEWNSSLPKPANGTKVNFRMVGNVMYVGDAAAFPFSLSQPLKAPVDNANIQLSVTNVGAAPAVVTTLPATGDATPLLPWTFVAVVGALMLVVGLKLPLRKTV